MASRKEAASRRILFSVGASRDVVAGAERYAGQFGNTLGMASELRRAIFNFASTTLPVFESTYLEEVRMSDSLKCRSQTCKAQRR